MNLIELQQKNDERSFVYKFSVYVVTQATCIRLIYPPDGVSALTRARLKAACVVGGERSRLLRRR
jgi:hypothetical protein